MVLFFAAATDRITRSARTSITESNASRDPRDGSKKNRVRKGAVVARKGACNHVAIFPEEGAGGAPIGAGAGRAETPGAEGEVGGGGDGERTKSSAGDGTAMTKITRTHTAAVNDSMKTGGQELRERDNITTIALL